VITTECPQAFNPAAVGAMLYISSLAVVNYKSNVIGGNTEFPFSFYALCEQVVYSSLTVVATLLLSEA